MRKTYAVKESERRVHALVTVASNRAPAVTAMRSAVKDVIRLGRRRLLLSPDAVLRIAA